jgi:hypothetical protein
MLSGPVGWIATASYIGVCAGVSGMAIKGGSYLYNKSS